MANTKYLKVHPYIYHTTTLYISRVAAPCADIRNFPYLHMIDVILKLLYLPAYQTLSVTL